MAHASNESVDRMFRAEKNPDEEALLGRINDALAPGHDAELVDVPAECPSVFVTGTLRSGTTLLAQLCVSGLDVGYISNLAAAFWKAPVYGVRLQQKLIGDPSPSTFHADYGRTKEIDQPHEFNYFWSQHLGYRDWQLDPTYPVDWKRIDKILNNIAVVFGRPVVYKAIVLGAFIEPLLTHCAPSCVVVARRDPLQTALAILDMRRQRWGSENAFGSMRPPDYPQLLGRPYWEQIAAQVHHQWKQIDEGIAKSPSHRVLEVWYNEICRDPRSVLGEVARVASTATVPLRSRHPVPECFYQHIRPASDDAERLHQALLDRFGGVLPTCPNPNSPGELQP